MAIIKCTKCETKITNVKGGIIVCPNCGHKMKYIPKYSKTNSQSSNSGDQMQNSNSKKLITPVKTHQTRKKKGCLFYFLLVMAILIAIMIIIPSPEDKGTTQNVAHRENMYGISNKNIDDIKKKLSVMDVRNDVTGKWKLVRIADNIDIEEYALSYYNKYFDNDDEIHAIVNFNYRTTTKISVVGDKLDVEIHEYVNKEEHDAKKLFSGMLYGHYQIYLDNGDIEKLGTTNMFSEESVNVDATPENFVNNIKNLQGIKEDEAIMDIKLENRDLCLYVDISKENINGSLPLENRAIILTTAITDDILTLNGYDELWDTITVDFGEIGKIVNSKANMETTSTGRYFIGNFELE